MKNLILSITRNSIPYVKELRKIAPSVTACILMQQLDYWFAKKPEGYYKFVEPCEHPAYKPGDSWCEELGFSAEEFETAFKKIGMKYKSKTEYQKAADKFQNKFYVCYYDRTLRRLVFLRNHKLLDNALDILITNPDKGGRTPPRNRESRNLRNQDTQDARNQDLRSTETGHSGLENPRSSVSLYKDTNTTTENNTDNSLLSLSPSNVSTEVMGEMISIWNKIVEEGRVGIALTPARKTALEEAFKANFKDTLDEWEDFCTKIASSKFLMAEVGTFRASIDWAVKPDNITKILEHTYKLGDRKPLAEKKQELSLAQKESIENTRQKKLMERKLSEIQRHVQSQRNKDLEAREADLSEEEVLNLKEEFHKKFINGEISASADVVGYFKESGWGMPGVDFFFEEFKQNKFLPELEEYLIQANEKLGYNIPDVVIKIKEGFNNFKPEQYPAKSV